MDRIRNRQLRWLAVFAGGAAWGALMTIGVGRIARLRHLTTPQARAARFQPASAEALAAGTPACGHVWPRWREIEKAYGPGSPFADFAQRLEATGYWSPEQGWELHGSLLSIPEASRLLLCSPGHLLGIDAGVSIYAGAPDVTLTIDLEYLWCNERYRPLIAQASAAVGKAMRLDDSEIARLDKIAKLVPRFVPSQQAKALVLILQSLPPSRQQRFTAKLNQLAEYLKDGVDKHPLDGCIYKPGIDFALGPQSKTAPAAHAVTLAFGEYDYVSHAAPKRWSLEIYATNGVRNEDAWLHLSAAEADRLP